MDTATIISVIGLLIGLYGFIHVYIIKPKKEKQALLIQFKATQSTSLKLQAELEKYITNNDARSQAFLENGITCSEYLQVLQENYKEFLGDHLVESNIIDKLPKVTRESMLKSLQQQYESLEQLRNHLKMLAIKDKPFDKLLEGLRR